ncbi:MAG: phytanoyl-CoA dioxygenase family protein [Chitinophagales bacterium]|nr:phytanoyl-CoA dioxygenase family protein [Chitinophagales bacterium]MDW8419187.1 phytanoyl-CoA dioxygenase family protein [Chitinophagales bacterium]
MAKRIFKNEEHQKIFDRQGFIVLPFLTTEEVSRLDKLFDELHPDAQSSGFFSGSYSSDLNYKKRASDEIVKVFSRAYRELFIHYVPFGGAFLYKVPGDNSELAAHQDWTIVDERKHVALNCWVPLCDVTHQNGALCILPGSHFDNFQVIRAPTLPFFFSGNEDVVMSELVPMEVPAGTAVILNQSVIHYSPPNRSHAVRKAITAGIKSEGAQMYFHYRVPDKEELEVFEMDDDFLIRFNDFANDIRQRPYLGRSIGFMPYRFPLLPRDAVIETIRHMKTSAGYPFGHTAPSPPAKRNFWQRLKEKVFA